MAQRESNSSAPVTDATAPFDDPKADVILRSSDNVDFRCHKLLLSMASTFFEGMFSLPQPLVEGNDVKKDGLHVVPMEERALVLETILRLCHPSSIGHPPVMELDNIKSIFDAARKYAMEKAEEIIRRKLVSEPFLEKPLRVYVIACALRLASEARIAAAATLEFDVVTLEQLDYFPEVEYMSAADALHLQKYQKNCRQAAQAITHDIKSLLKGYKWFDCEVPAAICKFEDIPGSQDRSAAEWWVDSYLVPCQRNLQTRPIGQTVMANELVVAALVAATVHNCSTCNTTSLAELEAFAVRFGELIDEATRGVPLNLAWMTPNDKEFKESQGRD
ncbi:hypothetical protein FIBSPDRAFT_951234 [Athelia psychrophila]|uniref:BTB domain-containing protein n=1 Tax=Athelia psychrophila TaxID=1759441 RepID=A0A166MZ74_9AGAM|nr:hypothetical protein FIBSPDRAFT_951234 [Fibularhizoctonia sp. CBS 109695]